MDIVLTKPFRSKLIETVNDCSEKQYNIEDIKEITVTRFNVLVLMNDTIRFDLHPGVLWELEYT